MDLTEKSLEDALIEIRKFCKDRQKMLSIKPTFVCPVTVVDKKPVNPLTIRQRANRPWDKNGK